MTQMKTLTFPNGKTYEVVDAQARHDIVNSAPPIKKTASGTAILLTDSADRPLKNLKIFGKTAQVTTTGAQLLPIVEDKTLTDRGLTQTVTGGVCVVTGTTTSESGFNLTLLGAYASTTAQFTLEPGTYTATDCVIFTYDGTTRTSYQDTFTLNEAIDVTWVSTRTYLVNEKVSETTHPMLNSGSEALSWEPYTGGVASPSPDYPQELVNADNPTVEVYGANLVNLPDMESRVISGITWSYENGVVYANGTATAQSYVPPSTCPLNITPGVYTLSGGANGVMLIVSRARGAEKEWFTSKNNISVTFDVEDGDILYLYAQVANGTTVVSAAVYPMITAGTEPLAYEPYVESQTLPVTRFLASVGDVHDEVDFERGVYIQRIAHYVFDGSDDEAWRYVEAYNGAYFIEGARGSKQYDTPMLCNYSKKISWGANSQETHYCFVNGYDDIVIGGKEIMTQFPTLDDWKTHIADHPIEYVYALATPIETALTEEELENFKMVSTHATNTTILNDAETHMEVEYAVDTMTYLNDLPKAADSQVQAAVDQYLNTNGLSNGFTLVDRITGTKYRIFVDNGKLTMESE